MSQQINIPVSSRPSRPSTPPLFSIPSPDFKNFKSWVRSSPFANDMDPSKETNVQLSDMDFEAAYAMFTAQTPPQVPGTPPRVHTPISSYASELTHQVHELNSQRGSKITSPGLSQFFQNNNSPNLTPADLENMQMFENYDGLLSANESNAIEQFLDSIMDEKSLKQRPEIHEPKPLQPALQPALHTDPIPLPQHLDNHAHILPKVEKQHIPPLLSSSSSELQHPGFLDTPETSTDTISITLNNMINVKVPRDAKSFPKELQISKDVPSIPETRSSSVSSQESRQLKKRKLLTEDEKKFNHTSSEQRRRGIIKDAFDDLVSMLPDNVKGKKKPPKSVVLEKAAHEIERLIKINNELRQMLTEN